MPLSEEVLFKPSLLIKEDFAGPTSLDLNAFFLLQETVWIGGSYRTAVLQKPHIDKSLQKAGAIVGKYWKRHHQPHSPTDVSRLLHDVSELKKTNSDILNNVKTIKLRK